VEHELSSIMVSTEANSAHPVLFVSADSVWICAPATKVQLLS